MRKTLLVLLFLFSKELAAKDFGVHGQLYDIKEKSILEQIYQGLDNLKNNGKLKLFQESVKKGMINSVNKPKGNQYLSAAQENRTWLHDPSVSLDRDLRDHNGKIFYRAYTRVNPLHKINMTKSLLFIDSRRSKEVDFALDEFRKRDGKVKIILTSGDILSLMKKLKTRLYFDQGGFLIKKFKIRHTPAIISQEKDMLRVEEVAI